MEDALGRDQPFSKAGRRNRAAVRRCRAQHSRGIHIGKVGFAGFGGARSQDPGTGAGTGSGTAAAAGPVVVGQVVSVSGTTVTVRNFGGKLVTVTVPEGTTVTSATTVPLSALKPGSTISVVGTTSADGKVTASALTTRTG